MQCFLGKYFSLSSIINEYLKISYFNSKQTALSSVKCIMSKFITLSIFSKHKLFQILEYQQASLDNKHWQIEEPSQVRISKNFVVCCLI